jgi:hypothetical protein
MAMAAFSCVSILMKANPRSASLGNISEVLEEGHQIRLRGVWCQVADVASGLPLGSLRDDHVVALDTMSGEVVVSERSGWRHAHGSHGLLLRNRGLSLLVGPVAANGARSKPLSIHGAQCALSISTIPESNESVTTRSAGLHVPHNTGF